MDFNVFFKISIKELADQFLHQGIILKVDSGDYFIVRNDKKLIVEQIEKTPEIGGIQNHISNVRIDLRGEVRDLKFPMRVQIGNMGILSGYRATLCIQKDGSYEIENVVMSCL